MSNKTCIANLGVRNPTVLHWMRSYGIPTNESFNDKGCRLKPTKEVLSGLISSGLSTAEISDTIEVSTSTINRWVNGYKIPRVETVKQRGVRLRPSATKLLQYHNDCMTNTEIANLLGVDKSSIGNWLRDAKRGIQ